jgi:hypothetical protein
MKHFALISLVSLSVGAAHAAPTPSAYPVLETYEVLATELLESSRLASTEREITTLKEKTHELIGHGVEIMKLYAERNPNCQAQFDVMISEIPDMESMTVSDLHDRYHDGVGLPKAPRHCYFGRSQVVHPAMNLVRLATTLDVGTRDAMVEEFEEVIEHLDRILRNLDNPPN